MPRKKAPCRDTATAPAQTDAPSLPESQACSPGVSEQCLSPGMGDEGGASSASKTPRGRGRAPRGQALAQVVASSRGRGKPVNTTHVFKTTASPCSDEDFSSVSRGRATSSRQNTSSKRALLQSINESTAPAAVQAHAGQTKKVGAAVHAPAKRAPHSTVGAATATQEAMLEQQTQDVVGQAAAPDLQFQVLHVRCMRACVCLWLMTFMQCCSFRHLLPKHALLGATESLLSCRATSILTTATSWGRCTMDQTCRSVLAC